MPSRLIALLGAMRILRLPPVVLLVRHIPDSLLSYFFKWRDAKQLGKLEDYVARQPSAFGVDVWWFIRFFNRWGALKRIFPREVLVVHYEDVERDPATWVRRIWSHWGVELTEADVAAAMAVSSHAVVRAHLDPAYGEDIAPDREARLACRFAEHDHVRGAGAMPGGAARHLHHAFGYATSLRAAEPGPAVGHALANETPQAA